MAHSKKVRLFTIWTSAARDHAGNIVTSTEPLTLKRATKLALENNQRSIMGRFHYYSLILPVGDHLSEIDMDEALADQRPKPLEIKRGCVFLNDSGLFDFSVFIEGQWLGSDQSFDAPEKARKAQTDFLKKLRRKQR